jgi:hypothetical protein
MRTILVPSCLSYRRWRAVVEGQRSDAQKPEFYGGIAAAVASLLTSTNMEGNGM